MSTRGAGDAFVAGAASRLLPPLGPLGRGMHGDMPRDRPRAKAAAVDAAEVRHAVQAGLRAARLALLEE